MEAACALQTLLTRGLAPDKARHCLCISDILPRYKLFRWFFEPESCTTKHKGVQDSVFGVQHSVFGTESALLCLTHFTQWKSQCKCSLCSQYLNVYIDQMLYKPLHWWMLVSEYSKLLQNIIE